jgi:hypothetical protein
MQIKYLLGLSQAYILQYLSETKPHKLFPELLLNSGYNFLWRNTHSVTPGEKENDGKVRGYCLYTNKVLNSISQWVLYHVELFGSFTVGC